MVLCLFVMVTEKLVLMLQWQELFHKSYIFRFLTTKDKFHKFVDSEWQSLNGGNSTKDEKSVDSNEADVKEPDAKKLKVDLEDPNKDRKSDGKRLRGQNKSRPHAKPTTYEEKRLCLSVIQV